MLVFLDESGDIGYKLHNKGSNWFVITILVCSTNHVSTLIQKAVKNTLRRKVNHKQKNLQEELKGTKTTIATKKYFY